MPEGTAPLVADSSSLIDLAVGGLLEELFQLGPTVLIADLVLAELDWPSDATLLALGANAISLNGEQMAEALRLRTVHRGLSVEDASVIVVAKGVNGIVLAGDRLLRQVASQSLTVHGTLWLLDRFVESDVTTPQDAAKGLRGMLGFGRWLPRKPCRRRLRRWEDRNRS